MKNNNEIIHRTITLSYDNLESCILGFLYATRTIPESWDVLSTEIKLPLNEDRRSRLGVEDDYGLVEIEIECVKPKYKSSEHQLEFPLEVFDSVHVKGS